MGHHRVVAPDAGCHVLHIIPADIGQHRASGDSLLIVAVFVPFAERANTMTEGVDYLVQAHQPTLGLEDTNLHSRVLGHVGQNLTGRAVLSLTYGNAQSVLTDGVSQVIHVGAIALRAFGYCDDVFFCDVHDDPIG